LASLQRAPSRCEWGKWGHSDVFTQGADNLLLLWLKSNLRTRWQLSHTSKYGGAPTKRPRETDAGERVGHGGAHAHMPAAGSTRRPT